MAGNIQLTPAELISQAGQMRALYEQYTSFFNNVDSVLKSINDSWSPNLANNFLSKITSMKNGCKNILFLIDNGINIAETSAKSFGSVDEALAKLMDEFMDSHGNSLIANAGSFISNITGNKDLTDIVSNVTGIPIDEYAEIATAIANGDLKSAVDKLTPGFTESMKDKVKDLIKDKTGLSLDPESIIESLQNGDITGALLEVGEAASDLLIGSGDIAHGGIADYVFNILDIVIDDNTITSDSIYTNDASVYTDKIIEAVGEGDWFTVMGQAGKYVIDVPARALFDAAGDTASKVVDTATKSAIGISISEINNKIKDWTGFNPKEELDNTLGNLGDMWHNYVADDNCALGLEFLPGALNAASDFIGGIGENIKKMF